MQETDNEIAELMGDCESVATGKRRMVRGDIQEEGVMLVQNRSTTRVVSESEGYTHDSVRR